MISQMRFGLWQCHGVRHLWTMQVKAPILPSDLVTSHEVKLEVGNASEITVLLLYSLWIKSNAHNKQVFLNYPEAQWMSLSHCKLTTIPLLPPSAMLLLKRQPNAIICFSHLRHLCNNSVLWWGPRPYKHLKQLQKNSSPTTTTLQLRKGWESAAQTYLQMPSELYLHHPDFCLDVPILTAAKQRILPSRSL